MINNLLIVADSDRDADMLYAVGMFVPDPFIYLHLRGKCHVVMNDLEIDRARREAPHCKIISWSKCAKQLERGGEKKISTARIIRFILREQRINKLAVPAACPLGLAEELRRLKIKVKVKSGQFFPERARKSAEEVKRISAALMMAEVGLAEAMQALKNSKVGPNRKLIYRNNLLTSEKLRAIIDTAILQAGGVASHTIVAGGDQACDPHERGHGRLRAGEPIVIEVFPRSQRTGYFGDISRTVVKGRASERRTAGGLRDVATERGDDADLQRQILCPCVARSIGERQRENDVRRRLVRINGDDKRRACVRDRREGRDRAIR